MASMEFYSKTAMEGDENTASHFAGDGEEDNVVASGGDQRRDPRSAHAALAGTLGGVWL